MKRIAILGASYLQLPLVEKAKSLGYETHCFAIDNELAVCKNICDFYYDISVLEKELICAKCQMIGIDGITTIATDIAIPTISFVSEKMNLISNSFDSAMKSTNKLLMRKAFKKYNIPSPKWYSTKTIFYENINFPLIVKPTDRSGSRGVTKVSDREELLTAIHRAEKESFNNEVIVEEFIEGIEISVEAISWKGTHRIITITDKITTGAPYFVEIEHHQPSAINIDLKKQIVEIVKKTLDSLEVKFGASHTEIKIFDNKPYVIEVGARMGGDFIGSHLVKLSTGFDYLKSVLEIALNKYVDVSFEILNNYSGIYFLSKETEYLLKYFEKNKLNDFVKIEKFDRDLIKLKNSNDRVGYIIYSSKNKINLQ